MDVYRERAENVTRKHVMRVSELLGTAAIELIRRAAVHDASKFDDAEIGPLTAMQELIETEGQAQFGSPEYERRKQLLGPMLDHHYEHNSHHPEHHHDGVDGMDLFDLIEMFFDWKAASERGGESKMGLGIGCDKYGIDPQLASILENTARKLGYAI